MSERDKTYEAVRKAAKLALEGLPAVRDYAGKNTYLVEAAVHATLTTVADELAKAGVDGITDKHEHMRALGMDEKLIAKYRAVKEGLHA